MEIKINTKENLYDAIQGAILGRRQYRLRISNPDNPMYDTLLNNIDENIKLSKYLLANRDMHQDSRHEMTKVLDQLELMKKQYVELNELHNKICVRNNCFRT